MAAALSISPTPLAPRPVVARHVMLVSTDTKANLTTHHSEKEWAAVYPHIERMYVHERRKLRIVMAKMEDNYGFKATVQMYKKRFTKWGFYKNTRRTRPDAAECRGLATSPPASAPVATHCSRGIEVHSWPLNAPDLGPSDAATFAFLTNIRSWSSAFFESATVSEYPWPHLPGNPILAPVKMTKAYDPDRLSYSFRVISGLLFRGQGILAGRLARKAFLEIEALLQAEAPLFIWNALEILYNLAHLGQAQVFRMLLSYLVELGRRRYPITHPAITMLRSLERLVPTSLQDFLPFQLAALERGWTVNADIVFGTVDPRFMLLYYRLVWDSVLVQPSQEKLESVDKWFALVQTKLPTDDLLLGGMATHLHPELKAFSSATRGEPPENYEHVRAETISEIRHRSTLYFREARTRIRVLSGLLKSRILEENAPRETSPRDISGNPLPGEDSKELLASVTPLRAGIMAYIIKILMEADVDLPCGQELAIDRMQNVIALRKYGQGPMDPRLAHELWELEDLLRQNGRSAEADAAQREASRLIEEYLKDIPVHVV
ncbi:hypothetical protein GQ53DRAFT_674707 [Thozetella sp. PMI_491]|nr:hypothetical protein GQ53DRAFT_674707 [Thozetella sp. PMI_491]